ncbi:MAG: sugar phosphate isomerase/epimerase [Verrucomicrobiaceae bacterium]|nr:sugar phosphate isomerase/epimerase [Verrucomicrobiaceae bacterium]
MKKLLVLFLVSVISFAQFGCQSAEVKSQKGKRNIAVQIYSFRKSSMEEAMKAIKAMGVNLIEASPEVYIGGKFPKTKMNLKMSDEAKAYLKKLLADNGMKFTGFGVINTKTEAEVEAYCKLAKEFDIKYILTEDPVRQFRYWQKYGQQYGVTMVVHHHANNSVNQYWNPFVMRMFVSQYSNVMSNPDIGHWARSGIKPEEALRILNGEIGSMHVKDERIFDSVERNPVPMGEGAINLKAVLAELDRQGYNGYLVIEHETDWDNPAPSIAKSVKFLQNN